MAERFGGVNFPSQFFMDYTRKITCVKVASKGHPNGNHSNKERKVSVGVDCCGGSMKNGILRMELAPVYVDIVRQGFRSKMSMIFLYNLVSDFPLLSVEL
jgi:hypothetical protein